MIAPRNFSLACAVPLGQYPAITIAHGGGGRLTRDLIERMFLPAFDNPLLARLHDGAVLKAGGARLAFTTDAYVVRPLFFPGGDIGALAVDGAVNDLAMCGARPLYLSASFILEEGLPIETLARVIESMRQAARAAGVTIVTGDTKVVDRGKGDGLYISTAGVGVIEHDVTIDPGQIQAGDAVLLSGDLGRHGIAIMAEREGLAFSVSIQSDLAPLNGPVAALLAAGVRVHCMRDLTRGGLGAALIELAGAARRAIHIEESAIPIAESVRGACEMLGLDPLYVANEGRMVVIVDPADASRALEILRAHPVAVGSCRIGEVTDEPSPPAGRVLMRNVLGTTRLLDLPGGEQLPRIC